MFQERFGGHGRRYEAQDVIDSLRNRNTRSLSAVSSQSM